jgi:lon-related putative ATP-dependent protease
MKDKIDVANKDRKMTVLAKLADTTELKAADLNYGVTFAPKGCDSTDDLTPCADIIGQTRAIQAVWTGLNVKSVGYNIFVTGLSGTGRTTTISHLLKQLDYEKPPLPDFCYVNNFKNADCPRLLALKAGDGIRFKKDMDYLIGSLRKVVPKIFLSEDFKDRYSRVIREFEGRQKELVHQFEESLTQSGFVMVQIQSGLGVRNEIQPLVDNEPSSMEKIERLATEGKFSLALLDDLRRKWDSLRREFDVTTVESKKLTSKLEEAIEKLNSSMIAPLVTDKINLLKKRFPTEKVIAYLDEVSEALLSDLDRFRETQSRRDEEESPAIRKREPFEEFAVNVILDNSETQGVPIIIEKSPSHKNLFGSLERVVDRHGYWRTDFTRIFSGSLLKASGGFLIINAYDLLMEGGVWHYLKRAIRNRELEITGYDPFYMMAGSGIKPEPISLDVKVVLIGEPRIYHLLWQLDDDFKDIFKIKAEFDSTMPLSDGSIRSYFEFVKKTIDDEGLPRFDLSGLQAVTEYGVRVAGNRNKITTRFATVQDLIRESTFFSRERKSGSVAREDVEKAIRSRRSRVNLVEDKIQEMFDENVIMVSTTGKVAGQINGLSVYSVGEYAFGRPCRITASVSLGRAGIINVERESDLSGPIHNKGVLVLSGYLRDQFAQDKPLAMSASITFEQSYGGVDGDSASSTEIYAILSALSGLPINQELAVTGSVNQKGEIQPIGGVTEKVEGWFDVCVSKTLTGTQGVIIPEQNAKDLLLRPDVIDAVKKGTFHIHAIKSISQGIELLMGTPAGNLVKGKWEPKGTVMQIVDNKLRDMALALQNFGRVDGENGNNGRSSSKKTKKTKKKTVRKRR